MNVTLVEVERLADHIRTFWFRPDHMPQHVAGQFVELYVPHEAVDPRATKRWFTLSSSPTEDRLGITTKFSPQESSSYKAALAALQPGQVLHMSEPMGDFVLPMNKELPLLFVAGGMGITPVRSMIKWLTDRDEKRQAILLYAAEDPGHLVFKELLETYPLAVNYLVSQPSADWGGETGRITVERILKHRQHDVNTLVYISGPEPMTETLVEGLKQAGIAPNKLVTDYFPGYPAL